MPWSWRRKVESNRAGRAARPALRAEQLETRDTPAGLLAASVNPGNPSVIAVYDATTQEQAFSINAFASFTGGVNVAVGDLDGDGADEIIAGAGSGGAPTVNIFSAKGVLLKTLTVGDEATRAGVSVATADFDGDGKSDILVGTMQNGQPLVEVLRFSDGSVIRSFTPFAGAQAVSVAAGDVNGDGAPDVIAGAGTGGGPEVIAFDGKTGAVLLHQFAFEDTFHGGVVLSSADLNGDGKADVIVGAGVTGGPRIVVFSGSNGTVLQNFFASDEAARNGVRATAYKGGSGSTELVTVAGSGPLQAFDGSTLAAVTPPSTSGLPYGPIALSTSTGGTSGGTTTGGTPTGGTPTGGTSLTDDSGLTNSLPPVNDPSWRTQPDGLKIWDVQTGSGTAVTATSKIGVFYTGYLTDGTVFDSVRSPKAPASFTLSGLIQGFQEGLIGMQPGGIRRLFIPAALGYGSTPQGSIPANSDLVFEIKLVSVS
jgi:hypothetical protein